MGRSVGVFAFAAILSLLVAACGPGGPAGTTGQPGERPVAGGEITFVLENDVINFDPMLSRAFVDRNVHYQIYDSLVRIDADGKIIPWLAESWEFSDGDRTVTFNLRTGVTYHDGSTFDAESVRWNIDRYRTAEGSARSGELASIDSVEVVDASTVRFRLSAPFAGLLANLVDRAGMMVSRAAAEAGGEDFTRQAFRAGTGPFMLTEAIQDDHMTLEKNPNWWGRDADGNQLPYLDKITVRPITNSDVRLTNLRTGDAHVGNNIAGKDVASVKSDGTLVYQEKPGLSFASIIPNRAPGFVFEDGRYVRAVSMAIDRQEIQERVFFGVGAVGYGPIAPPHFAFDPAFTPFADADPEGAKALVAQVGSGPLAFELLISSGDPQILQLAQLIQAQLAAADITAEIRQLQFAEILQLQDQKSFPGATLIGWSGRIDPDGNTYDHVYTDRPFNDSSYSNAEVDGALDEQRATTDEARRRAALRTAEQIMVVDDPARIWYRFGVAQLVTVTSLRGLVPYPDQLIRFQYAWLNR